jgi:hypothetical protein
MNAYLALVVLGAFLLFIPSATWIGIAFLAIGVIAYSMSQKPPHPIAQRPPKYLSAWPSGFQIPKSRPQSAGISVSRRDLTPQQGPVGTAQDPLGQASNAPGIENGTFSLPLPVDKEIADLVNVSYKTPTKARGFTEEKEKTGNPWLPGF